MLGIVFLFMLGIVVVLALSKSVRDFFVGLIGNVVSSFGLNTYVYDFSNFVSYILSNTIGQIWLGSMAILVLVMLFNIVVYGEAIR